MNKQLCLYCFLAFLVGYFFKDITGINLIEGNKNNKNNKNREKTNKDCNREIAIAKHNERVKIILLNDEQRKERNKETIYKRELSDDELEKLNKCIKKGDISEKCFNNHNGDDNFGNIEGISNGNIIEGNTLDCAGAVAGTVLSAGADAAGIYDGLLSEGATLALTVTEATHVGYTCT